MRKWLLVLISMLTVVSHAAPEPPPITINGYSPYFLIAKAVFGTQVMSGTVINGCTIKSKTSCPEAVLNDQDIQGAFLSYATLDFAEMRNVNVMLGDMSYAQAIGVDLSGASISGIAMNGADFEFARFNNTVAINTANAHINLSFAELRDSNFSNSSFVNGDLSFANFKGAVLYNSNFSGADLRYANFENANLSNAALIGAENWDSVSTNTQTIFCNTIMPDGSIKNPTTGKCPNVSSGSGTYQVVWYNPFYDAVKKGTPVKYGSTVKGCKLSAYSNCSNLSIENTNLYGATLSYANLTQTNFTGSNLQDTSLNFAKAGSANFSKANLIGVTFTGGNFGHASFQNTIMRMSALSHAYFQYANFSNADMAFTNLNGGDFRNANLTKVDLASTDVNGTDFRNANMQGINLSDADLTGSKLDGANLDGAIYCNTIMPDGKVKAPHKGLCPHQPK